MYPNREYLERQLGKLDVRIQFAREYAQACAASNSDDDVEAVGRDIEKLMGMRDELQKRLEALIN